MTKNEKILKALELQFDSDAGLGLTIRDYLYTLLITLWNEDEGFSSKRPFGNSGWEYDLYVPLIKAKLIKGKLDELDYVENVDSQKAHEFVRDLISACFYGVKG